MGNNHFNVAWAKSTALYTKAASVLGVGYPEMMVLYALESMGELTQKQIAENFGMQKQTVHTVVSALQKKGYLLLEASEGDKREKRIVLTESGQVYAHRMIAPLRKAEERVYRTIGNERLQAMCEILDLFNLLFERELSGGLWAVNNKRTFFQYVIPSVLSFALSGVYAIVDGFFVGNSIGDAGLSAINIAYPITAVLQSVGTGIGMGGSVKYSILKAAGNEKKAREFVAGATWLMLLFSAVLTVTVFFTSEKILSALGASGELLTLGNEYIKVIALGAILQVFGTGLVPFMRNYGGSLWAMIAMICGFATNIALDYTFVWVLGRGMYGAALATIIGQGVTMAVALVYCAIKKNLTLKIAPVDTPKTAFQILKIGLAPFGLTLAPNISLVIINRFSVSYGGQEAIATYACISYIICIVYLLLQGVGDGSQPLMSQFYGAGEEKSLKQTKTLAYEFSMVLAVISAILIYLLRGKIGLLFGSSAEVNAGVIKVMPIFLVSVPFDAITRVSTAAFYATEKSVLSYVLTFIEPIIMLVLMLMLPPVFGGQIMIWWSTVFAKVITASVSIVLSVRYSAQRNR